MSLDDLRNLFQIVVDHRKFLVFLDGFLAGAVNTAQAHKILSDLAVKLQEQIGNEVARQRSEAEKKQGAEKKG